MRKSPLSTLLLYGFHQAINGEENFEEIMDRCFSNVKSQSVLGHSNLLNVARIRLVMDLVPQHEASTDFIDSIREHLDDIISQNSLI